MNLYERLEERERENGQILALLAGYSTFMMGAAFLAFFATSQWLAGIVLIAALYCGHELRPLLAADTEVSKALLREMEAETDEILKTLVELEAEVEVKRKERERQ